MFFFASKDSLFVLIFSFPFFTFAPLLLCLFFKRNGISSFLSSFYFFFGNFLINLHPRKKCHRLSLSLSKICVHFNLAGLLHVSVCLLRQRGKQKKRQLLFNTFFRYYEKKYFFVWRKRFCHFQFFRIFNQKIPLAQFFSVWLLVKETRPQQQRAHKI